MGSYMIVFGVAAVACYLLTFLARRLAVRFGAVVAPGPGRIHASPLPDVGGSAMFVAFLLALALAWRLPGLHLLFQQSSQPLGVLAGSTVVFLVGFLDDRLDLSPPAKMAGLVLAGTVFYFLGVTMFYFRVPFAGYFVLSANLQPLLGVIWLAGMANAINFIDGLDGLAGGVCLIGAVAFFIYSHELSGSGLLPADNLGPLLAVLVVGVCAGFLPHNFHPAKIMMGDQGALFLGSLLAASTMLVGGRTTDAFSGNTLFFFAPLAIPLVILGVPVLDTLFAIIRRTAKRTSPGLRDVEHLHHRLLRLGHTQRRAVVIMWAWTAILGGIAVYPTVTGHGNAFVPFGILAFTVALYTLFHPGARTQRRNSRVPASVAEPASELA